jgi:hypothetical protein
MMLRAVINEAKSRNNILYLIGFFIFFFGLYVFLDFEGNTNYTFMIEEFGIFQYTNCNIIFSNGYI